VSARRRPALLAGYQEVGPLPLGYAEHRDALLAGRVLYLAIWHLATGSGPTAASASSRPLPAAGDQADLAPQTRKSRPDMTTVRGSSR
jgi:hypothetical protein